MSCGVYLQDFNILLVSGVNIKPARHVGPQVDLVLLRHGLLVPPLGSDDVSPSQESAPESKRSLRRDYSE